MAVDDLPAGSLELADLGYFSLEELQAKQALGQYFVCRYKVGTAVFTEAGKPLDLLGWLSQVETVGECRVLAGFAGACCLCGWWRFGCRRRA
jgi:hypothetical protein